MPAVTRSAVSRSAVGRPRVSSFGERTSGESGRRVRTAMRPNALSASNRRRHSRPTSPVAPTSSTDNAWSGTAREEQYHVDQRSPLLIALDQKSWSALDARATFVDIPERSAGPRSASACPEERKRRENEGRNGATRLSG